MKILVINAGSSSLKYQLIDMETSLVLAKGLCERIELDGAVTHTTHDGRVYKGQEKQSDHKASIELVIRLLTDPEYGVIDSIKEIDAVGHRMVHGGKTSESKIIDDELLDYLDSVCKLAPLHNPPILKVVRICMSVFGDTPQCAVFDTAFHASMEEYAFLYGLPYEYYEKNDIRKYGFHGTSHKYVSNQAAKYLNEDIKDLKIISCHLGNGSSITAVKGGRSIDNSMGFTPLDGLLMGTRCGSIDPSIILHFIADMGMSVHDVNMLLNKQSGLAGLSGISSDMRDLEKAAKEGNKLAETTINLLTYQIKKFIGSYVAAMNGVNVLIFTAGIGEHSNVLREKVCKDMDYLGIEIDTEKNFNPDGAIVEINKPSSKVKILVVPTDEEFAIALDTLELVD